MNVDSLKQLLGCYFHQDWPDEFADDLAVVNAMLTNESADLIAKGVAEIDSLLSAKLSEGELRAIVTEQTGCCFEPMSEGLGYGQWLYRLRSTLKGPEATAMKLLSVDDVRAGLDRQFLPLEPMFVGFRLIERPPPANAIEHAEKTLAIAFPDDFRELIARFDFGNLTVGPIVFGTSGNYPAEITRLNLEAGWWGPGKRPDNLLMIANSDPFAILSDTRSGCVYALDPELGLHRTCKIADSFLSFFLGLGTIVLMRQQVEDRYGLATAVSAGVGSGHTGFWLQMAS